MYLSDCKVCASRVDYRISGLQISDCYIELGRDYLTCISFLYCEVAGACRVLSKNIGEVCRFGVTWRFPREKEAISRVMLPKATAQATSGKRANMMIWGKVLEGVEKEVDTGGKVVNGAAFITSRKGHELMSS